jgi:hypothetical protein
LVHSTAWLSPESRRAISYDLPAIVDAIGPASVCPGQRSEVTHLTFLPEKGVKHHPPPRRVSSPPILSRVSLPPKPLMVSLPPMPHDDVSATADFIVIGPTVVSSAATAFVARDALVRAPVPAMRTNISEIRCNGSLLRRDMEAKIAPKARARSPQIRSN